MEDLAIERRLIKLEEHCPFNSPEKIAVISENINVNLNSLRSDIKRNDDDIRKILLLNRSLVDQGKSQGEIIQNIQAALLELKNIKIIDPTSNIEMDVTFNNFSKYILERINPDKQVKRWADRLKNWGYIISVVILFLAFIFGINIPTIINFFK